MTAFVHWATLSGFFQRGPTAHDPLCIYAEASIPPARCPGCLLVELRSDAAYGTGDEQMAATAALTELFESTRMHLQDATGKDDPQ